MRAAWPRIDVAGLPHDERFFRALPVVLAAQRARLTPRRRSAIRWALRCPVCRELPASGTLVVLSDGAAIACRYGCPAAAIRAVLEHFAA